MMKKSSGSMLERFVKTHAPRKAVKIAGRPNLNTTDLSINLPTRKSLKILLKK
jgi:hypothetical protein